MKKTLFWGGLLAGIVAIGFYAVSKLNLDLSLSNAARALVNQSSQELMNAPQNAINKMKEIFPAPQEIINAPQKILNTPKKEIKPSELQALPVPQDIVIPVQEKTLNTKDLPVPTQIPNPIPTNIIEAPLKNISPF